ncbi:MAG: threonine synthase [Alphaproteobacteria bacterium]
MKYISTRGGGEPQNFEQVLLTGLAPDGGLYVPETWPKLDLNALKGKSYVEIAEAVIYPFVEGSIDRGDFRRILNETYGAETFRDPAVVPLKQVDGNMYVLELFHGPTIAFKDVALQLLGRLFDHVLERRGEKVTIVGATSGDTGSAAIEGCRHSAHTDIFILHPHGRVSDVQRRQMTTVDAPNVHNIAVQGTFDDCQNMVKAMFGDEAFRDKMNLSAVNSINWARIMAQIVYYVTSALALGAPEKDVTFVVPTGNFGNVFAAYSAKKMGLPAHLAVATNQNDILTRFFESGEMKMTETIASSSPSMDIQISSNFERYLFDLFGRDSTRLKQTMEEFKSTGHFAVDDALMQKARQSFSAYRCSEEENRDVISRVFKETGYTLDPHTAAGYAAAEKILPIASGPVVTLATAHPAKFPDAVEAAIGQRPKLPAHLSGLMEKPEFFKVLPNDLKTVQDFIKDNAL